VNEVCAICGSAASVEWLRRGDWLYRECVACSAVWLDARPVEGWAENFYDQGYFAGGGRGGYRDYLADETQHRSNARTRILLAQRAGAAAPATWVDVGCAVGFTLDEARRMGFTSVGVEPGSWACGVARERFGLTVFPTLGEAIHGLPDQVDVVSMFQVLEHLPDPFASLGEARACLRTGGILVIETWDRGSAVARLFGRHWQQITPPSVLWIFDRKSLVSALERAGFRVSSIRRTSKKVSVGWVLGLLEEKLPQPLAAIARRLALLGLSKLSVTYRLGDLITVVATAASLGGVHDSPDSCPGGGSRQQASIDRKADGPLQRVLA
jgi:SAM-dependent methyltransferase